MQHWLASDPPRGGSSKKHRTPERCRMPARYLWIQRFLSTHFIHSPLHKAMPFLISDFRMKAVWFGSCGLGEPSGRNAAARKLPKQLLPAFS